MSVLVMPDMHQRSALLEELKRAAANHRYDRIICLGDYVDDFRPEVPALEYLERILAQARAQPDRIVLLLGNHDAQYLYPDRGLRCTGFQPEFAAGLTKMFRDNRELLRVAYAEGNYLFTHAGIGPEYFLSCMEKYGAASVEEMVELTNKFPPEAGYISAENGGRHQFDGPLWLRPWTYRREVFPEYLQVVGHTQHEQIQRYGNLLVTDVGKGVPLSL